MIRSLFLILTMGCASAINAHYPDGMVQVVSDDAIQEMHTQASFMQTTSVALRYSNGVFITINTADGRKYFRSLSHGIHSTPTVPEPRNQRDRHQLMTFTMSVLPGTLFVYRSRYKLWVHIAGNNTNVVAPVSLRNHDGGTWAVQPYNSEWIGVYGVDGVYTRVSVGGAVELPSRGVSFVAPPNGKCIQLWIGEAKTDKVCAPGPHVNIAVTGISIADPESSSAVEGTAAFYVDGSKVYVNVDSVGFVLAQPRIFNSVQVPDEHMMEIEDEDGRVYYIGKGTVPLYRYAIAGVKRLTLVKGEDHYHPRIWDGIWGIIFTTGQYDIGSHVFHREKQWCHRLWVPSGYLVTVTRKGWWDSNASRVHTYGQGEHDISYGLFGIGDTPIERIEVVKVVV